MRATSEKNKLSDLPFDPPCIGTCRSPWLPQDEVQPTVRKDVGYAAASATPVATSAAGDSLLTLLAVGCLLLTHVVHELAM